ncbi:MAG: DUF4911 domain-containing protein [Pseudomonadota bacterium]
MFNETTRKIYRIDRCQIHFLKFILEGYDSMAIMRTIDPSKGMVEIFIAPGCEEDVDLILQNLSQEIMLKEVIET